MDSFFASHQGAQKYGYETEKYTTGGKGILNNVESVVLEPLHHPSPATEFKQSSKPKVTFTKLEPCVSADAYEHLHESFVLSREHGYKKAGFKDGHLLGEPATNVPGGSLGPYLAKQVDVDEPVEGSVEDFNWGLVTKESGHTRFDHNNVKGPLGLEYGLVNEEKARFKYGYSYVPPNLGKNIPGSDSLLQRDRDNSIRPHKRAGGMISGRYSGWESEGTSINGMIDPYKT